MGQVYAQYTLRLDEPIVGLLSNGEEDSKSNEVTKETYKLLSKFLILQEMLKVVIFSKVL